MLYLNYLSVFVIVFVFFVIVDQSKSAKINSYTLSQRCAVAGKCQGALFCVIFVVLVFVFHPNKDQRKSANENFEPKTWGGRCVSRGVVLSYLFCICICGENQQVENIRRGTAGVCQGALWELPKANTSQRVFQWNVAASLSSSFSMSVALSLGEVRGPGEGGVKGHFQKPFWYGRASLSYLFLILLRQAPVRESFQLCTCP